MHTVFISCVQLLPYRHILQIGVRRDGIQSRCSDPEEFQCLAHRSAGGIVHACDPAVHLAQPYIRVHGKIRNRLAGFDHLLDVGGELPGTVELRGIEAEDFLPSSCLSCVLCYWLGHLTLEFFLGSLTVVACASDDTRLIFNLDCQDAMTGIRFRDVSAELCEGCAVALTCRPACR